MSEGGSRMTTYEWIPPGPGSWMRDPAHQTSAWTRYLYAMLLPAFDRGYREGFARYGVLLDHLEVRILNGWMFARPRPVGAPEKPGNPPPKLIFKAMFLLHPELRRRAKTAREIFRTRAWRKEAEHWYNEERDRVAEAIRSDPKALAALRAEGEASGRIELLRAASAKVRSNWDGYVTEYGHRTVTGFDVDDKTLRELPSLLLSTVAAQVQRRGSRPAEEAAARLRERVPNEHRGEYDDLLLEAAQMYGLRDDDVGIGE